MFNYNKCKALQIARVTKHNFEYTMNNITLEQVSVFNDLGITISCNLERQSHSHQKVNKANSTLAFIKRTYGYSATPDIHQYLQLTATVQRHTRSTADDFKISINSARTEKAMEYYFHRVVKPWNTIPYHVRSTRCNNNEIVPFKSWLAKHYMHLTLTYHNSDNVCIWVSFCRCSGCRPVWMKHNNHTCSTVPPTFPTNPHVFISMNVPCVMLYQQQCKWHPAGSHVWLGMCLV